MIYRSTFELPEGIRNVLPEYAQEIFLAAYNKALKQHENPDKHRDSKVLEQIARKAAWAAVEKEYKKNGRGGTWGKN